MGLCLLCMSPTAKAADWRYTPTLVVRGLHDSNIRLSDPETSTYGGAVTGSLLLQRRTEVSSSDISGKVTARRYSSDAELNRVDREFSVAHSIQGARWTGNGSFDYLSDSTLTTLYDFFGQPVDINTARKRRDLNLSAGYQIDERSKFSLAGEYQQTGYDRAALLGLSNTDYASLTARYDRNIGERLLFYSSTSSIQLKDRTFTGVTDDTSVILGGQYRLSEVATLQLYAGVERARYEVDWRPGIPVTHDTGITYGLVWSRQWEKGQLKLSVDSRRRPSSDGQLDQERTATLDGDYHTGERSKLTFTATSQHRKQGSASSVFVARDYYSAATGWSWHWSRTMTIGALATERWLGTTNSTARRSASFELYLNWTGLAREL